MGRTGSGGSSLTFEIKDSGARAEFAGGMIRDTTEGKVNYLNVRFGPMLTRWAAHLTKGREKYPDPSPGVPNWTLAAGMAEYLRAKESAARHFEQWVTGERDEDHAAAVYFNINLAEYVLDKITAATPPPLKPNEARDNRTGRIIEFDPSRPCGAKYCLIPGRHEGTHVSEW